VRAVTAGIPADGLLQRSSAALVYPNAGVQMAGLWIEMPNGVRASSVPIEQAFTICYAVRFDCAVSRPIFGIRLSTTQGQLLFATNTLMMGKSTPEYNPGDVQIVRWPVRPGLGAMDCFISCGCSLTDDPHHFLMREVDSYQFTITGVPKSRGLGTLVDPPILEDRP
jgi:hypothetical protein